MLDALPDIPVDASGAVLTAPASVTLLATRCPSCPDALWDAGGRCPTCGIEREEVVRLLRFGCLRYEAARDAALDGRFADARQLIRDAYAAGFDQEALRTLDALCALTTGASPLALSDLPSAWREAAASRVWRQQYEKARQAALDNRPEEALSHLEACLDEAPYSLPARKLRLLALQMAGRADEAETGRTELLGQFPGEPDLLRYHFDAPPPLSAESVTSLTAAKEGSTHSRVRSTFVHRATAVAASLLVIAAAFGTGYVTRPAPPGDLTPAPLPRAPATTGTHRAAADHATGVKSPATPTPTPTLIVASGLPTLPGDLQSEVRTRRVRDDVQQARRWFNRAVAARTRGQWADARKLADAAYRLSPMSYLADDALLLRSQAGEDGGDFAAAQVGYRLLAERFPNSPYAPLARARVGAIFPDAAKDVPIHADR